MKKLFVYADFDWLETPQLIGELSCDSVRGSETYGFSYDREWLAKYGDVFLSEDLQNYTGIQYTRPEHDIFACFSDALPDGWGRTLLNRREQIAATDENRAVRRLTSFDYLMGIDDASRMGGFRFAETSGGNFINCEESLRVPPLANVRELMRAAHEIELSEEKHLLPSKKWLVQLLHPGTSLGGARPKASVIDVDGSLTVAKFPSRKDDYDVAQWEDFCHVMGRKAGLNVAETRTIDGEDYHILLSKRFDRNSDGRRIHFASALTLLGLTDGDNASTGYGYTDIVDFIVQHGSNVEQNLEELYRRVAFYIIVGNTDDHLPQSRIPINAQRLGTIPGIRHQPDSRRKSKPTDKSIYKRIRPQYSIGIRWRVYAFSGQSQEYYQRSKNRHEILAHRSPQTRTPPARHRHVRTSIR